MYFSKDFGIVFKQTNVDYLYRIVVPENRVYNPTFNRNGIVPDAASLASLTMIQRRQSPDHPEEIRDVYGYFDDNQYLYRIEANAATNELKVAESIAIPVLGNYISESRMIDVGKYHISIYSGANCDAVVSTTNITASSVWFYTLGPKTWSCMPLDNDHFIADTKYAWSTTI